MVGIQGGFLHAIRMCWFHGVSEARTEEEEAEGSQGGWQLMVKPKGQRPRMDQDRKAELCTRHVSLKEYCAEVPNSSSCI